MNKNKLTHRPTVESRYHKAALASVTLTVTIIDNAIIPPIKELRAASKNDYVIIQDNASRKQQFDLLQCHNSNNAKSMLKLGFDQAFTPTSPTVVVRV